MRTRVLYQLVILLVLAACGEDQPPTAPASPDFSQVPGHPVVNSLTDPGDGICNAAQCTLREAINAPGSTEISFAPDLTGPITLAPPSAGGGTLTINKTLSITGPSARMVIRRPSTDLKFRIFQIGAEGVAVLSNLVITGGKVSDGQGGGGIDNTGTLTLNNSVVTGNRSVRSNSNVAHGGGIGNFFGTLTLINSTVSGNTSDEYGGGIDNNTESTLFVSNSVITGNSAPNGGGIFNIEATLTLTDTRVSDNTNGDDPAAFQEGAGIDISTGVVTLNHTSVSGNSGTGLGGGIANIAGTLRLTNCTVRGNTAAAGGGIGSVAGIATFVRSTISGNSATGSGGGVSSRDASATFTNSTVSGNSAGTGGGIWNAGTAKFRLRSTTVARNAATEEGGGIKTTGPITFTNSLVALNTAPLGPDLRRTGGATITSRFSLFGIANGSGSAVTDGVDGNRVGSQSTPIDPRLGPLADNGGLTKTHALLLGSPAVDAGSTPDCPPTDQRGVVRPLGPACDIGSYEQD